MITIFEDNSLSAIYSEEKKRITFKISGYVNIEKTKNMYLTALEFMKTHRVVSFMNDITELKGTFTALTTWMLEDLYEMLSLGLKYDALILNKDIFTQFAANDFATKIKELELQLFNSVEDAEKWLNNREMNH